MNKRFRSAILLLLITGGSALSAQAGQWGVRAGEYTNTSKPFGGVELLIPIGSLTFDPNVEYVFKSGYRLATINADFAYSMSSGAPSWWLGAGPALIYSSGYGVNDTKVGLNIFGGIGWKSGAMTPYVQAKEIFAKNSSRELVIGVGLRF